jgi:dynein light chain 4
VQPQRAAISYYTAARPGRRPPQAAALPADFSSCRIAKYPLVASSDCTADVRTEAVDVCVAACERHAADLEKCTQTIKDALDKRFGGPWHVVVGRAFAFEVTYEVGRLQYLAMGTGPHSTQLWADPRHVLHHYCTCSS